MWRYISFMNNSKEILIDTPISTRKIYFANISNTEAIEASKTFYAWDPSYGESNKIRFIRNSEVTVTDSCRVWAVIKV